MKGVLDGYNAFASDSKVCLLFNYIFYLLLLYLLIIHSYFYYYLSLIVLTAIHNDAYLAPEHGWYILCILTLFYFLFTIFFFLFNNKGDMADLQTAMDGDTMKWDDRSVIERYIFNSHCSVLVKVADDFSELYVGHTTWSGYVIILFFIFF